MIIQKIIDIGAGTGKYSIELAKKYDVTAVELVKHNLRVIEQKNKNIKTFLGSATNLNIFNDNSFDIVILFGPMYHLINYDEKLTALNEAKRITKKNGYIFISYCLNEYAVITHGFKEKYINECIKNNQLDDNFKIISSNKDLYSYVRINEINKLKNDAKLKRVKILSQDGPSEYLKKEINSMDENIFNYF